MEKEQYQAERQIMREKLAVAEQKKNAAWAELQRCEEARLVANQEESRAHQEYGHLKAMCRTFGWSDLIGE